MEKINTVGRRKSAIARVYLTEGTGKVTVNKKDVNTYFTVPMLQYKVFQPFNIIEQMGKYDVYANIDGGGISGQASALQLGIARALCKLNIEFRPPLKAQKMLTRDPREVERKKYGRSKARKRFQFSKR